jgi:predicted small integral membrane protein
MRAFLSLVIAVVASAVGHGLLWAGGLGVYRNVQEGSAFARPDIVSPILLTLGVLLVGVAMLTAAFSSLGVILLGIVHIVSGAGLVILPPTLLLPALRPIEDVNRSVASGFDYSWASGVLLLTGVLFFVGGIAAASRRARPTAAGRVVSAVLAVLLGAGLVPLVALGGARLVRTILVTLGSAILDLLGLGLLAAAVVVLIVIAATARWSSLGVLILGVLLTAAGGVLVFAPLPVLRLLIANPPLVVGLQDVGSTGGLLLLGVLILALGIAAIVRGRRRRREEPAEDDEESIGYQRERHDGLTEIFPPADRV